MRDNLNELEHKLERATAPECPTDRAPDAETASLRDAWLAFVELLETVHPALDLPPTWWQPPERRLPIRRKLVAIAALAASLLVALTLSGKWVRPHPPDGPASLSEASFSEKIVGNVEPSGAAGSGAQPRPPLDEPDWEESLDQQIALAGQEVVRIQQDWHRLDDAFGPLYHGLEQMEQDLAQGAL